MAYCATCDGEFFTGKEVLVVGGGIRRSRGIRVPDQIRLQSHRARARTGLHLRCRSGRRSQEQPEDRRALSGRAEGVTAGQGGLREASILNLATGQTETWKPADAGTFGVFVFAGYVPATDLVRGVVELDDHGYVVTHDYLRTSVPGVYAAGDLRVKNLRQVVTATSDGAIAAVELERYAKQMSEKTGLVPPRPTASAYEESEPRPPPPPRPLARRPPRLPPNAAPMPQPQPAPPRSPANCSPPPSSSSLAWSSDA